MKTMRCLLLSAVAAVLVLAVALGASGRADASQAAAQPAAQGADLLKTLEPYIGGEWKCVGKWSDGRSLDAREVYTWGIGKKFVKVKTYLSGAEGEYQRYEAMYGVKDGGLMSWSFAYDGTVQVAEWKVDGRKWSTSNMQKTATGTEQVIHQSIELIEPDKFRWLLEIEADGKRQTLFDGHWVREGAAGAS